MYKLDRYRDIAREIPHEESEWVELKSRHMPTRSFTFKVMPLYDPSSDTETVMLSLDRARYGQSYLTGSATFRINDAAGHPVIELAKDDFDRCDTHGIRTGRTTDNQSRILKDEILAVLPVWRQQNLGFFEEAIQLHKDNLAARLRAEAEWVEKISQRLMDEASDLHEQANRISPPEAGLIAKP
jgi:hypothetical protein